MPETLEQVLADMREEVQSLRRARAQMPLDRVGEWTDAIQNAAEEWLTWLSESDAAIRCGFSEGWLRARFEMWKRDGHARMKGRARQYRACVVPRRADVAEASNRGRAAAREQRRAS